MIPQAERESVLLAGQEGPVPHAWPETLPCQTRRPACTPSDNGFCRLHINWPIETFGDMRQNHLSIDAVVQVISHRRHEILNSPCTTRAIALLAAGYEIALVVAAALRVWCQVIQGQLRAVFDRRGAVGAGHPVSQVERQSFFFP